MKNPQKSRCSKRAESALHTQKWFKSGVASLYYFGVIVQSAELPKAKLGGEKEEVFGRDRKEVPAHTSLYPHVTQYITLSVVTNRIIPLLSDVKIL